MKFLEAVQILRSSRDLEAVDEAVRFLRAFDDFCSENVGMLLPILAVDAQPVLIQCTVVEILAEKSLAWQQEWTLFLATLELLRRLGTDRSALLLLIVP